MAVRLLLTTLCLTLTAAAQAATPGFWYEPGPLDATESALAQALAQSAFGGAPTRAAELTRFAAAHPGTPTAGLALVESGRLLLEERRLPEAITALSHPDVARTALRDYAQLALGRAHEAANDAPAAATAYLAAADTLPGGPLVCPALLGAANAQTTAAQLDLALTTLTRAKGLCPPERTPALLDATARALEAKNDLAGAAAELDRLDREFPASSDARAASARLARLASLLPATTPDERTKRTLAKAEALIEAELAREALAALKTLPPKGLKGDLAQREAVLGGRALAALGRRREAEAAFVRVPAGSPHEGEAAFYRARLRARSTPGAVDGYEDVANRFPKTPWAERSLLALAQHYQKDSLHELAVPYYRTLLADFPDNPWARQAAFRVAWSEYRQKRHESAAAMLERAARRWPQTRETAAFLYWAGRNALAAGQAERGAALLSETARRYKHSYHGMLAREGLARLPPRPLAAAPEGATVEALTAGPETTPSAELPEPARTRVAQLLLVSRTEDALNELRAVPANPTAQATIARVELGRGRLRPAIVAMKRAYPWHVSEAGDVLPPELWRVLFPLDHADALTTKAREQGLDPALVAGLICQESTFAADALSPVGARGLMQIMPPTGRSIAKELGVPFVLRNLYDPAVSLQFGTHYLAGLVQRFGGRIERALAAYNAGPHRVDAWTANSPDIPADEFVEEIPFTETRHYVATILANQAQYRRIYSLAPQTLTASEVH